MITEAAVEAAARIYQVLCFSGSWESLSDYQRESRLDDVRQILEAAEPHMGAAQ